MTAILFLKNSQELYMTDRISFVLANGVAIHYAKGVVGFTYDVARKELIIDLQEGYVCDEQETMREYNVSCRPWRHSFFEVICISAF